jgi:hypothetical protein
MEEEMGIKSLNGWQRLWVLTSLIYLTFVIFIAVIDFSKPWNSIPPGEIKKNLSEKSLLLIKAADKFADKDGWIDVALVMPIKFPDNTEVLVPADTKQVDLDYINKDSGETSNKLTNKMRINFIGKMFATWLIPCLVVYALGLSFHWVYRGFKINKSTVNAARKRESD